VVTISDKSLGGGIKTLGEGVETGAGSEGNMGISSMVGISSMMTIPGISKVSTISGVSNVTTISGITEMTISSISVESIGISFTLANMVTISVVTYSSLGGGIKSLGKGVKTGAGSKGNMSISSMVSGKSGISKMTISGISTISGITEMTISGITMMAISSISVESIGISFTLAKMVAVVSISDMSLGGGIKSLGERVKTSAGSERNMSISSMVSGKSGISKMTISSIS
jgi:hypothetical protein